jgi:hypothetical protein
MRSSFSILAGLATVATALPQTHLYTIYGRGYNGTGNPNGWNGTDTGAFNAALVPEFGIQSGQNPDGTGNCDGNNGVLIPCQCPPDRNDFIEKVKEAAAAGSSSGVPVQFPTDNSKASEKQRIQTAIIVLQNFNGQKGSGCPAAATTFLARLAAA